MISTVKKSKFKPIGDRVLLRRCDSENEINGIILPDSAKKKQESAEVIAIGPGKKLSSGEIDVLSGVSVGDIVLIDKYSGQEVSIDDEEFIIVKFTDIVAVIEN